MNISRVALSRGNAMRASSCPPPVASSTARARHRDASGAREIIPIASSSAGTSGRRVASERASTRRVSRASGTNDSLAREDDSSRAVRAVIVPGYLADASAYGEAARALERALDARSVGRAGRARVDVVPLTTRDWWPTLAGGDFSRVARKIDAAVRKSWEEADGNRVVLVGHSAGGWLGRLYLGDERYAGETFGGRRYARALVTLGTPHASAEAYPFGRVPERRDGEREDALSADARGSSLAFVNEMYPGAFFDDVRYVSVVGDVGPAGADAFDVLGAIFDDDDASEPLPRRLARAWRAFVFGVGYRANCRDARARGDGVVPIPTAVLDRAETRILPGVHHQPSVGEPWYGSPEAIELWCDALL